MLVTLSYARVWRLPGGGRGRDEDPEAAVLRELREEIGSVSHGVVQPVARFSDRPDFGTTVPRSSSPAMWSTALNDLSRLKRCRNLIRVAYLLIRLRSLAA